MRKAAYISVWMFIAAIPLDRMYIGDIVNANIPVTVTQIVGIVALMVALVSTLFEGSLRRFDRAHAFVYAFIIWVCLSSLWSIDPESALERVITFLQLGFMVWLLCQYAQSREDQIGFMTAYLVGAGFVSIQLLVGYAVGGTVFSYEIFPGRYTSMGYNPNDLALTLAVGIPMAWYVFTNTAGLSNLIAVGYMPVAMAGILLSASRGGTFAALVALLVLPLGFFKMTHGRKVVVILALAAAGATAVTVVPERSWERLTTIDDLASEKWSIENLTSLDLVNMRVAIWMEGLEMFRERPFIGIGAGGYINVVDPVEGERRVAHNVFLSILVELGLIGLALFLTMIVVLLLSVKYMEKDERVMWLMLIATYLVGGLFLTWEQSKQTWLIMGLLAARAVPLRAHLRLRKPDIPDETKAVIARHIERQRWDRTRELAVDILLAQNHLSDSDPAWRLFDRLVAESDDWGDVSELIEYLDLRLAGQVPTTVGEWRVLAEEWAEDLRRLLVSDF